MKSNTFWQSFTLIIKINNWWRIRLGKFVKCLISPITHAYITIMMSTMKFDSTSQVSWSGMAHDFPLRRPMLVPRISAQEYSVLNEQAQPWSSNFQFWYSIDFYKKNPIISINWLKTCLINNLTKLKKE